MAHFKPIEAVGIRRAMIEMILATDNAKHTKYLSQLENKLEKGNMFTSSDSSDDQLLMLRIALHAADVSNVSRISLLKAEIYIFSMLYTFYSHCI